MGENWGDQLDDRTIRRTVGTQSFDRGATYARDDRVSSLTVNRAGRVLFGAVRGARSAAYRVTVTADADTTDGFVGWSGRCTCPVGVDCKHVAAVMLAARDTLPPVVAGAEVLSSWEGAIAELVEAYTTPQVDAGTPLALQLEITTPNRAGPRYRGRQAPTPGPAPHRRIRVRPVVRGRSGTWVRTGVSWRELQYDYGRSPHVRAQREALRALYTGYLAYTRSHYSSEVDVHLDALGPSLWPLLKQATDAGLELVPVKDSAGPITVGGPASISLDLRRATSDGHATLDPVLTVNGRTLSAASVSFLGDPLHGLFVENVAGGAPLGLLLAPLDQPPSDHVARMLRSATRLRIPPAELSRFLETYYPVLRQTVTVMSSDGSVVLPEVLPPRLALTVVFRSGHEVSLDWSFAYRAGDGVEHVPLRGEDSGVVIRDRRTEQRLLDTVVLPDRQVAQLTAMVAGKRLLAPHATLTGMDAVTFTEDMLPALRDGADVDVTVLGTPPEYRAAQAPPLIHLSATESSDDTDWYDLGVRVSIDGEEIPFDALFVALAGGARHMVLDTGTYFALDRPQLDELRRLIEEARALQDRASDGLRISVYQADLWEELLELGVVEAQSQRWARTMQGLLDIGELSPADAPRSLDADLRPYQLDGYQWLRFLWEHGLGGILADDMGLGKTVQTLAMICHAREAGALPGPFLVVAPTSVVPNWAHEAARFAPELKVVAVTETVGRRCTPLAEDIAGVDVVITSYALFRIGYDDYSATPWAGLILDEAQFVKNHQAKSYQCARRLTAPFKLAITGTPLENSLMDLWSLMSIVAPGLFPSPQRFSDLYRKPIERGTDPELLATLRRRIRPLMRRRTKEQVMAELPPKQEQVLEVTLNPQHRKIYQTHLQRERQKVLGLIDDLDRNRFQIFRSLTLLRQLSLDPGLVDEKYAGVRSSKVDAFLEQLHGVVDEGHRALVFSQFTGFLGTVRARLDAEGIRYSYLDGRTSNRGRCIDEFKNGDAPVFLISLKAGGVGLNLTEADYVFVLDPWWNPAVEAQAVDRTHRIGQDKTVMVYRLVAAGTIEEKVMELKARKQNLFTRVMDDDALLSAPLTADDIKALFS